MTVAREALKISLEFMDYPPEVWLNLKEKGATRLIMKQNKSGLRKSILLKESEVPLFEYSSGNSYSLITSKRVISERDNNCNQLELKELFQVRRYYYNDSYKEPEPWRTLRIISDSKEEFLADFGEDYPCYFAKILITNLSSRIKFGKWVHQI